MKNTYFKVVVNKGAWVICTNLKDAAKWFNTFIKEKNTDVTVVKVKLTEKQFDKLPDFEG